MKDTDKRRTENRPATRKQNEFARIIGTEPKTTLTQAYKQAYNVAPTTTEKSAQEQASRMARNPQVLSELDKYTNLAENAIVNTIKDWKDHDKPRQREIAMQQAQFVHDKVFGRSKQSVQVQSTTVNLNLDLTSDTPLPEVLTDEHTKN